MILCSNNNLKKIKYVDYDYKRETSKNFIDRLFMNDLKEDIKFFV